MEIKNRGDGHWEGSGIPSPPPGQFWKSEWGKKPRGYHGLPPDHYSLWRDVYADYLLQLYSESESFLKLYKATTIRNVDFEEFAWFAYTASSGYISPYA